MVDVFSGLTASSFSAVSKMRVIRFSNLRTAEAFPRILLGDGTGVAMFKDASELAGEEEPPNA
jgi:hypothetical protein